MNRRGFLAGMLAACAAPAVVKVASLMPVRGLIVPSQVLIVPNYMAGVGNQFLTVEMITREALKVLDKTMGKAFDINRDWSSVYVRRPDHFLILEAA